MFHPNPFGGKFLLFCCKVGSSHVWQREDLRVSRYVELAPKWVTASKAMGFLRHHGFSRRCLLLSYASDLRIAMAWVMTPGWHDRNQWDELILDDQMFRQFCPALRDLRGQGIFCLAKWARLVHSNQQNSTETDLSTSTATLLRVYSPGLVAASFCGILPPVLHGGWGTIATATAAILLAASNARHHRTVASPIWHETSIQISHQCHGCGVHSELQM